MSAPTPIASSSDLSKQPRAFAHAGSATLDVTTDPDRQYGHNNLPKTGPLAHFVARATKEHLRVVRHLSPVVKKLPLKSSLLDVPAPLETALEEYRSAVKEGKVAEKDFEVLLVRPISPSIPR